jgi:hypothetical protein
MKIGSLFLPTLTHVMRKDGARLEEIGFTDTGNEGNSEYRKDGVVVGSYDGKEYDGWEVWHEVAGYKHSVLIGFGEVNASTVQSALKLLLPKVQKASQSTLDLAIRLERAASKIHGLAFQQNT